MSKAWGAQGKCEERGNFCSARGQWGKGSRRIIHTVVAGAGATLIIHCVDNVGVLVIWEVVLLEGEGLIKLEGCGGF